MLTCRSSSFMLSRSSSSFLMPLLPSTCERSLFWTGLGSVIDCSIVYFAVVSAAPLLYLYVIVWYLQSTVRLGYVAMLNMPQPFLCILSRSSSSFRPPLLPSNLQTYSRSLSGSKCNPCSILYVAVVFALRCYIHSYCICVAVHCAVKGTLPRLPMPQQFLCIPSRSSSSFHAVVTFQYTERVAGLCWAQV